MAALVMLAAGVARGLGAPPRIASAAILVALPAVLPGDERADQRGHPR